MKSPRVEEMEIPVKLARRSGSQYGERSPCKYGWNHDAVGADGGLLGDSVHYGERPPAVEAARGFLRLAEGVAEPALAQRQAALVADTVYHMPSITWE